MDVIKAAIWPALILFLALFFRGDMRDLLPRLRRAGRDGVEFEVATQKQSADPAVRTPGTLADLPGLGRTEAIAALERQLHDSLEREVPDGQRVDRLVRLLAEARITAAFEAAYRVIFGSQIQGLRTLNERGGAVLEGEVRKYFEEVSAKFPDVYGSFSFEEWLGFLLRQGLVERGAKINITPLGIDFLHFLTARQLPENKPF